jgi:hypothetical protein
MDEKEIFVLSCYCNTSEKIEYLYQNIKVIKRLNIPIAISSHYPVPEFIYNQVNFFIYDGNNILAPDWSMSHWYKKGDFKIMYENPYKPPYHGAAVYSNLKNAVNSLVDKYTVMHFLEGDSMGDYGMYLDIVRKEWDSGKRVIGFPFSSSTTGEPTGLTTNILTADIGLLKFCLPEVKNWDEYTNIVPNCYLLENLLLGRMISMGFSHYIGFIPIENRQRIAFKDRCAVISNVVHFIFCDIEPNNLVLFVINAIGKDTTYKIDIEGQGQINEFIKNYDFHYYLLDKTNKKVTCSTEDEFSHDFFINENSTFFNNRFKMDNSSMCGKYKYIET